MKSEDLFLAIGAVEEARLAGSEWSVSSPEKTEDRIMKVKPGRFFRNCLIAAIIVSMLAVTAYAVTGFLIFENPQEMVTAIFGDNTGFDHSAGSIRPDPLGGPEGIIVEPTFDRVEADETLVAENIVPHVEAVGRWVSFDGYTLTVDAFMYDSTTRCGFVTYLLENPNGVGGYKLQSTGEIWYEGRPDTVEINQYGYPFIIQEKTTDTCLAASYYFKWDPRRGDALELGVRSRNDRYSSEEFAELIAEAVEKRKQEITPEEAIERIRQQIGTEAFEQAFAGMTQDQIAEQCYTELVAQETAQRLEQESGSEVISIPLKQEQKLEHITAGDGSIVLTPISMRIDITDLTFLHTDRYGNHAVDCGNIDSIAVGFADGSDYTVTDGYVLNYAFDVTELPEENVATEVIVSPEEDPNGEGYIYIENSHGYCLDTIMFNRIIDIDEVSCIVINGTRLPVD